MDNNRAFGEINGEKLEFLLDGERVKLFDWDKEVSHGRADSRRDGDVQFHGKAGPHTVGVTFLATNYAPGNDLISTSCAAPSKPAVCRASSSSRMSAKLEFGPHEAQGRQRFGQPRKDFRLPARRTRARKPPARSRSFPRWRATLSAAR